MIKYFILLLLLLAGCSQKQNNVVINDHKINIELADTEMKRTQGLSGKESLCPDCGMLFTFNQSGKYGFWMKDMKFSLDFIYIYKSEVVELKENISPDTYPELLLPETSFDKVIEVNAGFVKNNKISVGQKISLDLLNK